MSSDWLAKASIQSLAEIISSALHAVHEIEPATADDIQSWNWKPTYPVLTVQDIDENTFRFEPHGEEKVCEISKRLEAGDQKKHAQFEAAHGESHGKQTQNLQENWSQNAVHSSHQAAPFVPLVILGRRYVSRGKLANSVARNEENLGNVDDVSREIVEYSQEKARANAVHEESICTWHSWQQKAREWQNAERAEFSAVPIGKANQLCRKNQRFQSKITFSPSLTKIKGKGKSLKSPKGKGKLFKNVLASDKFVVQSIDMLM